MNRQLRKRHRVIWFFLAPIIPFLLLISWLLIPQLEPVKAITSTQPDPLPVVLQSRQYPHYEVELRTNNRGDLQLEWWSRVALRIPSAVIYQVSANGQRLFVGRIETRGHYRFPLQTDSTSKELNLQLYDFIHEHIIDTINISL